MMSGVDTLISHASGSGVSPAQLQTVAQRHARDGILKRAEFSSVLRQSGIHLRRDEINALIQSTGAAVGAFVRCDRVAEAWAKQLQLAKSNSARARAEYQNTLQRWKLREEAMQASTAAYDQYGYGYQEQGTARASTMPPSTEDSGADTSSPPAAGSTGGESASSRKQTRSRNPILPMDVSHLDVSSGPGTNGSAGSDVVDNTATRRPLQVAAALRARLPVRDASAHVVLMRKLRSLDGDSDGKLHLRELRSALSDLGVHAAPATLRGIAHSLAASRRHDTDTALISVPVGGSQVRSARLERLADSTDSSAFSGSDPQGKVDFEQFASWALQPRSLQEVNEAVEPVRPGALLQPEHFAPRGHGIPGYDGSNAWRWLAGTTPHEFTQGPRRLVDTVQGVADAAATCPAAQGVFQQARSAGRPTGAPRASEASMPGVAPPPNLQAMAAAHCATARRRAPLGGRHAVAAKRPPWAGGAPSQQRDAPPPQQALAAFAAEWQAVHGSEGAKDLQHSASTRAETAAAFARDASGVPPAKSPADFKILKPRAAAPPARQMSSTR